MLAAAAISEQAKPWRWLGQVTAFGVQFAACIAIGIKGGEWLDEGLGTAPWMTSLGMLVGLTAAAATLWQLVRAARARLKS